MTPRPQRELLRWRRRPDGVAVPVVARRDVAGRSAYVCPDRECLRLAIERRGLQRTLTGPRGLAVRCEGVEQAWTAALGELDRTIATLQRTRARPDRVAVLETLRGRMRAPRKGA
jgi:predicted RNA-binding protein YlxR (DUF448 family)